MSGSTPSPQDVGLPFAHLHLHTEYSLLDGGNQIAPLIEHVKALGMTSVAITDHGNLHGAIEFYTKARAAGAKPILGIEAYVAVGDRRERKPTGIADGGFHLVLLAENGGGWRNLLRLSSDSFLEGFYYRPRMDKETLARWSDGLIAINGHLGSSIAHYLLLHAQTGNREHYEAAKREAVWHRDAFGVNERGESRFFIEVQRSGVAEQERINPLLVRLARELDVPIVRDNDAHFMRAEDYDAHDSLCCISMQKVKTDPARLQYSRELYVKSPAQMAELFADLPEALLNAARIAERCNVEIDFTTSHAPVVRIAADLPGAGPDAAGAGDWPRDGGAARAAVERFACDHPRGSTEWFKAFCARFRLEPYDRERDAESPADLERARDGALRLLAEAGAVWRYGDAMDDEKRQRLDRELTILADKRISAYFLVVWDFVSWARQNGIPAAARGSGVGTMVGYVLGLSNACPVRYGLLFERFTDPDRGEYPDIDVDICQDGRGAVIDYVRRKYGYVAQIITFGRLKARQAIKDVARVSGLPASEGQRLANLVPAELNITIDAALEKEPDLRAEYDRDPGIRRVVDTARALENHARHAGVHAAGVVVATQPLETIVPLGRAAGGDDVVTQWDGPTCEKVGLLKMDFLGLRTLSTIELAIRIVRETLDEEAIWRAVGREPGDGGPHPLDLERIEYDDQRVLALFRRADAAGVFQFESGGMRKLLLDMQPDRLEDLIAANALFRPGPMDLIPEYCMRKHGRQPVPQVHEIVDRFTAETYGIMVYQEQVMQIVHGLGDIPLRQAYTLIKAISKKKHSVIDAERSRFIEGAKKKGLNAQKAEQLFDLVLKFAGYGFNKSHSTGYAIIAYQTAYLKTYFPAHYMAAVLTYESGARKVEEWAPYIEDCRRTVFPDHTEDAPHVGVEVRPPDLNRSRADFSVVYDEGEVRDNLHGHIRFGLGAIKGVGQSAVRTILEERDREGPFASVFDFCERVSSRTANKAIIEALVRGGAFDSIHGAAQRAALVAAADDAITAGQQMADDRRSGQMNMFEMLAGPGAGPGAGAGAVAGGGAPALREARPLPSVPPWDELTMLAAEKETLGIHLSGHPLDRYAGALRAYATTDATRIADLAHETPLVAGGVLSRVRFTVVKQGKSAGERMAIITLSDRAASVEGVVFSSVFARDAAMIAEGAIVLVAGRADTSRGAAQVIVDRVMRIEDAPRHLATRIEVTFEDRPDGPPVESLMQMAAGHLNGAVAAVIGNGASGGGGGGGGGAGRAVEVLVRVRSGGRTVTLRPSRLRVVPELVLIERLGGVVGAENVRIVGGAVPAPPPRARNGRSQRELEPARA